MRIHQWVRGLLTALSATALLAGLPPRGTAAQPQADTASVARGAVAWANSCDRCHNMREPAEFRDDQWRAIMAHMRVRAGLTGQETRDILAFLQASNSPAQQPSAPVTPIPTAPTTGVHPGKAVYTQTCLACHGADGKGALPGVPDLTRANGPLAKSDAELIRSITAGVQRPGAPLAMPPKGGNPNLTETDIRQVLDYMRQAFGR
ncbi:MAG: c-type cytochrome [Pseudomonadota bacterium]